MGTFASVVSMNAFLRVVHGNAYEDVEEEEDEDNDDNEDDEDDEDDEDTDDNETSSISTATGGCCEDAPYDAYHSPSSCQWTRMVRRVVSRVALAPVDEDDDEDEA